MTESSADNRHLYHIRILRTYLEYIRRYYPEIDTSHILDLAGISKFEYSDEGYWYTQEQSDRFHDAIDQLTGNSNIAREAGRYGTTSASYRTIRQYIFSYIEPSAAYELLGIIGSKLTKGTSISIKKITSNRVEAVFRLNPGVNEKPYQCQNRLGMMEAMAMPFCGEYATVQHDECIHKGSCQCTYTVSWNEPRHLKFKRIRNRLFLAGMAFSAVMAFFVPAEITVIAILSFISGLLTFSSYISIKEKQQLSQHIEAQGKIAEELISESDKRYRDAEMVREMGQVIANMAGIEDMLNAVMTTLKRHLDYDQGMLLLANENSTRLLYRAGFGYTQEQESLFRKAVIHLDNPRSKGQFVRAFREQKPYLVKDVNLITTDLSANSRELLKLSGVHSFICVPVVFENVSMGILTVDNTTSHRAPSQSDLNFLMGIAPQIAISINNAKTFQKMQESEEKYRVLVENANSIILRLDPDGRITFANSFALRFYGYTEQEILGRPVFGFLIPIREPSGHNMSTANPGLFFDCDRPSVVENENILNDGSRAWVSWSTKPIISGDGSITEFLCVGNDITLRKKTELERNRLEAQLIRAQKMEAIGALAGGVAHDLNNILSGITSYPELLLMDIPENDPMREPINIIKKSGDRAAAIVQDLLTLARRGVSVTSTIELNTIIKDYFSSPEFRKLREYHPHVEYSTDLADEPLFIRGSGVHLSKTIMNLVSNASEAITEGGMVRVTTGIRHLDTHLMGYETIPPDDYIVLSVSDTGTGISPDDLKRIFEPFFSKKIMGRSGTGLGMTVVWSTIKDHNGYINIETAHDRGTLIELYLPSTEQDVQCLDDGRSMDQYSGHERILVVDDAEDQRSLMKSFLGKLGYSVVAVSSGEEAVDYIKKNTADLIILDMILEPGIDGLDTYRELLELNSRQKAIIVSGYSETDRVREALRLGAGAYIRKPYALIDLVRAARTELDRK